MANHVAGFLAAHGPPGASRLGRGDGCAILADNDARWCAAYLGVLQLGCVAVPLDTAYKGPQIAALLRDSGARVLFTAPKYLPAAREAAAPPPSGAGPWRSTSSVGVPASVTASRAAGRYFGAVNRTLAPLSRSNAAICGPLYAVSRGTATQPSCSTPR